MVVSGITVRHIGPDAVDAFRQVRLEALRSEPSAYASSASDWEVLTRDEWQQRLLDPVFLVFDGNEPVGVMGLLRQRASKMAHRATIVMVYLRRNYRGAGLAKQLLDTVSDYARIQGIVQLELTVSAENPGAVRFYEREGFTEVGRIPGGFLHEGREIADIVMVRRLV